MDLSVFETVTDAKYMPDFCGKKCDTAAWEMCRVRNILEKTVFPKDPLTQLSASYQVSDVGCHLRVKFPLLYKNSSFSDF